MPYIEAEVEITQTSTIRLWVEKLPKKPDSLIFSHVENNLGSIDTHIDVIRILGWEGKDE